MEHKHYIELVKMDWDFYSNLIEEDVFSSFLNANEPMFYSSCPIEPPKEEEVEVVQDSNLYKLAKNRESAKNTRKKKKQHLEYLEKRVAELNEEVESLRQETKTSEDYHNGEITQKYKSDKQKLFDTLEVLLNTDGSEENIKVIIETLRTKLGASGVERQGYIEYLIRQIADISLPNQVKSLLNIENNKDNYFWDQMLDLNFMDKEQQEQLERYILMINKKAEDFKATMKKLKRIKKCLLRRTGHLQNILDYISSQLSATQIAALLVRINKEGKSLNPWAE